MSWSKTLIGKAPAVVRELKAYSEKLNGDSKAEYDAALPHMVALVSQNFVSDSAKAKGYLEQTLHVEASGHGSTWDGAMQQSTFTCKITTLAGEHAAD